MAAKYWGSKTRYLGLAMVVPLAAMTVPVVPTGWSAAQAAVVKKAKKRKVAVKKPTSIGRVCTVTVIKHRKVTRCRTVPVAVPPAIITAVPAQPVALAPVNPAAPAIGHPVRVVPVMDPPPPMPAMPQINPADYYWIDQADSLAQAFGNSPPDFTFSCDGVDCWAWVSRGGEVLIVEPGRQGVQQYFFAPQQSAPYLVRDSYNAFGFSGRDLVAIYDSQGHLLSYGGYPRERDVADALRERGRALYAASLRQRHWDRGSAAAWIGGYSSLGYDDGWNYGWNPFWRELPGWDRYDRDRGRQHPPRHLGDEHRDRDDARRRYDDWHRRGAPGAPPPTGNPVVTPTDGGVTPPVPRPPHGPRPVPQPAPQPVQPPAPQPGWQPQPRPQPQPQPAAEVPPPLQGDAPLPRRERPRREIEPEPGAPPIPLRQFRPEPQPREVPMPMPIPMIEAQAPPPPPPVRPEVTAPSPQPVPQYVAPPPPPAAPVPAPVAVPAVVAAPAPSPVYVAPPPPLPPPPPPPPPPRDEIRTESPIDGGERP